MTVPFTLLAEAVRQHGSPLWAYDASTIAERVEQLNVFDTVRFAQKANPNLHVLRLMRAHGLVLDAVSLGEMERAFAAGASVDGDPAGVVLTCDALDRPTLERVVAEKIEVNAGSIDMLRQLGERSPGHRVWIRINPGFGHGHSRKTNTGGENSKHGIWHEELDEALACIKTHGLHLVGVHMHIGSGVDYQHLEQVARSMIELIGRLGVDIEAFSIGGGLSTLTAAPTSRSTCNATPRPGGGTQGNRSDAGPPRTHGNRARALPGGRVGLSGGRSACRQASGPQYLRHDRRRLQRPDAAGDVRRLPRHDPARRKRPAGGPPGSRLSWPGHCANRVTCSPRMTRN